MYHSPIYVRSPVRIQEFLLALRSRVQQTLRGRALYREYLQRAITRESWTAEQLHEYQIEKLAAVLGHAARNVPYYSNLFRRNGIRYDEIRTPEDMLAIPALTKHDIQEAGDALIAQNWTKIRFSGSTSGTTGTPVQLVQDLSAINRENAFISRQLGWAGYRPGLPRAWIRGDMVAPADSKKPPYWRLNRAENTLMMSSYHLAQSTADLYIDALNRFEPVVIQAYPSSINFLAKFLQSRGQYYASGNLSGIVTSSETLTDDDRRLIESRFRCRVYDWYGAFERVAAIGTCEHSNYHLLSDYSFVEFSPVGNGKFEIIGTGFNNFLMPLIRFRTGDLVELSEQTDLCGCGRSFPIVRSILGRQDDYIKLSDGRRIGRMDHVFKGLTGIAEAQIVQDELDRIRILVVPFGEFSVNNRQALLENVRQRLGADINVDIEIVPRIARSSNGKFRSVVCNI